MIGLLFVLSYFALFGPRDPRLNLATVLSWILWWPLLAVSFFLFGRVWCAVCPMGALADLTQRFSLNLKAPRLFKRRGFVAAILLVAILYQAWIEEVTRAAVSPLVTGFILWGFTAGAVVGALLFERWTWCRHLCPLGAWAGVFAMGSVMEIRADQRNCVDKKCYDIYCYFGRGPDGGRVHTPGGTAGLAPHPGTTRPAGTDQLPHVRSGRRDRLGGLRVLWDGLDLAVRPERGADTLKERRTPRP